MIYPSMLLRRAVQAELRDSTQTREQAIAGLGEWAVLSVLAGAGSVAILDPANDWATKPAWPPPIAASASSGTTAAT